ncbi:MAG TPA: hypothetical protein VND19_25360 [Acetobacteraceae bacterium]|nr:hypothetical protein [Acetobacteraceae bacterium]
MKPPRKRPNARAVRTLSSQAEQAAAQAPDKLAELSVAIKIALQSEADPYVMLGVLLEGLTQTLITRIPPERHLGTLTAALVLLRQRLADRGAVPGQFDRSDQQPTCN